MPKMTPNPRRLPHGGSTRAQGTSAVRPAKVGHRRMNLCAYENARFEPRSATDGKSNLLDRRWHQAIARIKAFLPSWRLAHLLIHSALSTFKATGCGVGEEGALGTHEWSPGNRVGPQPPSLCRYQTDQHPTHHHRGKHGRPEVYIYFAGYILEGMSHRRWETSRCGHIPTVRENERKAIGVETPCLADCDAQPPCRLPASGQARLPVRVLPSDRGMTLGKHFVHPHSPTNGCVWGGEGEGRRPAWRKIASPHLVQLEDSVPASADLARSWR